MTNAKSLKIDAELTPKSKAYVEKMFRCQPPCDSFGFCEPCCEKAIFQSGYNMGYEAGDARKGAKS